MVLLVKMGLVILKRNMIMQFLSVSPVLSFVHQDIGNLPSKKCEETDERRQKLMDFRKKVCADRLVKFYMTVEDLRTEVVTSIDKCIKEIPMRGWIRASADP